MGYNARNDEIRDNVTRMRREWEAQRNALATVRRFNATLSVTCNVRAAMAMAARASSRWRGIRQFEPKNENNPDLTKQNSHSWMVKRSSILGINILAMLPLASKAGCAVSAAMIVPAIMARTASKYFRIVIRAGVK